MGQTCFLVSIPDRRGGLPVGPQQQPPPLCDHLRLPRQQVLPAGQQARGGPAQNGLPAGAAAGRGGGGGGRQLHRVPPGAPRRHAKVRKFKLRCCFLSFLNIFLGNPSAKLWTTLRRAGKRWTIGTGKNS